MGSIRSCSTLLRHEYRLTRANPVSMTKRIPGTVNDVSATLVAKMMRRAFVRGAKISSCSDCDKRAYKGSTCVPGGWCLRSASEASRISRSPGKNTKISPAPTRAHSSTASTMALISSRSSSRARPRSVCPADVLGLAPPTSASGSPIGR